MLDILGIDGAGFVITGLLSIITDFMSVGLELFGGRVRLLRDGIAHVGNDLWGGCEALSERTEAGMAIYVVVKDTITLAMGIAVLAHASRAFQGSWSPRSSSTLRISILPAPHCHLQA
jgi:hypothetical protein